MLKELIADLHKLDTRWIELVGRGKPTFHPNFDQIVEMLKDHRFTVGIATNGTLLTPKQCKHLIHCRLDGILVSLNAATCDTYRLIHTAILCSSTRPKGSMRLEDSCTSVDKTGRYLNNIAIRNHGGTHPEQAHLRQGGRF
ncbi:hypothetical protein AMJ44_05700 [candidate division WOR-1 bacterium DG_54_3]|uniref:Radical SAM core domain-containing protein n=1 Tax=candidate division WOR-1 bacterium DG_54_3 TaxID=1703775 RepID=A0A0S7Y1V7_UNCSA|nr:MAG: hypothetical protein AMJ44_05700 [candidate division WOR-1 bacterium DG_54_3]